MEFYSRRSLRSFIDEEQRSIQYPTHHSSRPHQQQEELETDHQMSPRRHSTASTLSHAPSSPGSPWTLSPLYRSPPPSLLYHCLASLHRQDGNIFSIAISKGIAFTGSASNRIRIWRLPECIEWGHIKSNSSHVRAIVAYGNTLFTTHKDRRIRIWATSINNRRRSKKIASLPRKTSILPFPWVQSKQHKDTISCLAYYHAEGLLYSGSHDRTVKAWRVANGECVDSFLAHDDQVTAIVVRQEDGCVFTSSADGSVKIWRRVYEESSHTLTMTLRFESSPVNALALSSSCNSCYLYSGSSDGYVNFWEKETVSERYNHGGFLPGHQFSVLCLVAIERLVFSGSEDTTIRVWRREEGSGYHTCLVVLEGHRGAVKCISACLEMEKVVMGLLVYSASSDGTIKVWRIMLLQGEQRRVGWEEDEWSDVRKDTDSEVCPVLSPAWVEKKLLGMY